MSDSRPDWSASGFRPSSDTGSECSLSSFDMTPQAGGVEGSDQNGRVSARLVTSCAKDCTYIPFDM